MAYEVITLNLIPSGDIPVIHAAQYDVDRPLKFALKLGEDDFNPTGYELELQIRKVDNNIVTAASDDVTNNVVTFNTTEQMTACSGTNLGEIQITKDDLDIATLHFYLVVQRDVLAGGITSESEIHNLTTQIEEIAEEVIGENYYTKTETDDLLNAKADTADLAPVATSGSYDDLTDKPDIPDVSDYYDKEEINTLLDGKADVSDLPDMSNYYDKTDTDTLLSAKADISSLAAVATSGDYDDILNKPTIPTNAEQLPIESGSVTNTKDYIDSGLSGKQDAITLTSGQVTWNNSHVAGNSTRKIWYKYGRVVVAHLEFTPVSGHIAYQNVICSNLPKPNTEYTCFGGNAQQMVVNTSGELIWYYPTDTTTLNRWDITITYISEE